jgi:phage-related protein
MLLSVLELYQDLIYIHESVIGEVMAMVKNSGSEKQVFELLATRLAVLAELRERACDQREFEPLGSGIYSMHTSTGNKNLRFLYLFYHSKIYILHAFFERAGKKKTDYTGKIELAKHRLEEM